MKVLVLVILALTPRPVLAEALSLNQQLIIACYKLDAEAVAVVTCIREGANVDARFGKNPKNINPFYDRWTGGTNLGTGSWTPLIALAASPTYPDPPAELGNVWKDSVRSLALQKEIPREQIDKRRRDMVTILFILLSHRCNLNCDDGYGATALYKAVDDGKVLMAKVLLEFGENPNTKTGVYIDGPDDTTPLHVACNSKELMQMLLDHGADSSAKDSNGDTPADWVALDDKRDFDLAITSDGPRIRPKKQGDSGKRAGTQQ